MFYIYFVIIRRYLPFDLYICILSQNSIGVFEAKLFSIQKQFILKPPIYLGLVLALCYSYIAELNLFL